MTRRPKAKQDENGCFIPNELACSRFASVYHEFNSIVDFVNIITKMTKKAQNKEG